MKMIQTGLGAPFGDRILIITLLVSSYENPMSKFERKEPKIGNLDNLENPSESGHDSLRAPKKPTEKKRRKKFSFLSVIGQAFILMLALIAAGRFFGYYPFKMVSDAMNPLLSKNEIVIVHKDPQPPTEPNSMIIYYFNNVCYLRRVAAKEGQTVQIQDGQIIADGKAIPDFDPQAKFGTLARQVVIPKDSVFVVGTTYGTGDSIIRGPIETNQVWGKVVFHLKWLPSWLPAAEVCT